MGIVGPVRVYPGRSPAQTGRCTVFTDKIHTRSRFTELFPGVRRPDARTHPKAFTVARCEVRMLRASASPSTRLAQMSCATLGP